MDLLLKQRVNGNNKNGIRGYVIFTSIVKVIFAPTSAYLNCNNYN